MLWKLGSANSDKKFWHLFYLWTMEHSYSVDTKYVTFYFYSKYSWLSQIMSDKNSEIISELFSEILSETISELALPSFHTMPRSLSVSLPVCGLTECICWTQVKVAVVVFTDLPSRNLSIHPNNWMNSKRKLSIVIMNRIAQPEIFCEDLQCLKGRPWSGGQSHSYRITI